MKTAETLVAFLQSHANEWLLTEEVPDYITHVCGQCPNDYVDYAKLLRVLRQALEGEEEWLKVCIPRPSPS